MTRTIKAAVSKVASKTDVEKGAYVPTAGQRELMRDVGFEPRPHEEGQLIPIHSLSTGEILETSYYQSLREGSGRIPEVRMGRGILKEIEEGGVVCLFTDGDSLFLSNSAVKVGQPLEESEEAAVALPELSDADLLNLASSISRAAKRRSASSLVYERDSVIREYVRRRCNGTCERPGCGWSGFVKPDGSRFIEVHHVKALSEGGADAVENVIGLCPNCHREAHLSARKEDLEVQLREAARMAAENFHAQGSD